MTRFWWEKTNEQDFVIPRSDTCSAEQDRRAKERGRDCVWWGRASLEQRPNKMRQQATLLFGGRTFQAESTAQAKALRWALGKEYGAGVYDTHREASLAGALVHRGDVWCELRSEESWEKVRKDQCPDRDSRFFF